jgi:ABC-2 type transport system ATP-binding protein
VKGVTQIQVSQLSEAATDDLKAVLARHHVELKSIENPTSTLEELFLNIVQSSDSPPK